MAEPKAGTPCTLLEKLVLHSPRPSSPSLKVNHRARDLTALFQAVAKEEALSPYSHNHNGKDTYTPACYKKEDQYDLIINHYYDDQANTVIYLHGAPLSKTFDIWEDNKDSNDSICAEDVCFSDIYNMSAAASKDKENMPPTMPIVEPAPAKMDHVCSTSRSHLMELQLRNFVSEVEALWRRSLHTKTKATNFGKRGGRRNRVIEMTAKANSRSRIPKSRQRVNILFPLDDRYLYSRYK